MSDTAIREFTTAAKTTSQTDEDEGTSFKLDGRKLIAYEPNPGQFAMLMASVGRGSSDVERVAGFINFVVNVLDEPGADYVQGRLLDRKDPFGIEQMEEILDFLTETWTGNPTQGPSGSTQSPPNDGPKSTPPTSLLT